MKIYFVRHGESIANTEGIISNRGAPHPLTTKGRQQAQDLARKLSTATITKIFTSPILRARQTAEILAQAFHVPLEIADALREYDCGVLEGQSVREHENDYRKLFQDWQIGRWDSRFEGGESLLDIKARFVPFIDRITHEFSRTDNLVLVSHGGTLLSALPFVLTNVDRTFTLTQNFDNTAVVMAEITPEGLVCRSWFDQIF